MPNRKNLDEKCELNPQEGLLLSSVVGHIILQLTHLFQL